MLNKKLAELTEEELKQVTGGQAEPCNVEICDRKFDITSRIKESSAHFGLFKDSEPDPNLVDGTSFVGNGYIYDYGSGFKD